MTRDNRAVSDRLLPLFPLNVVLFPRTPLPLHIFEERYKEMISEAITAGSEFGVVQASRDGIVNTGCTASVERVLRRYEDGRLDILCIGRRRFEVLLLNQERSFLCAEVTFFDDEDDEPAPIRSREAAVEAFQKLRAEAGIQVLGEPDQDDARLSFQVAQLISDNDFRQMLLGVRSETERLGQFISFVPKYLESQRQTNHVKRVAPLNGHGGIH